MTITSTSSSNSFKTKSAHPSMKTSTVVTPTTNPHHQSIHNSYGKRHNDSNNIDNNDSNVDDDDDDVIPTCPPPTPVTNGVADYFAILGMGPTLIPKRNNPSSHHQSVTDEDPSPNSTPSSPTSNKASHDDEETIFLERFYREIVDVKFICKHNNISDDATTHSSSHGGQSLSSHAATADIDGYDVLYRTTIRGKEFTGDLNPSFGLFRQLRSGGCTPNASRDNSSNDNANPTTTTHASSKLKQALSWASSGTTNTNPSSSLPPPSSNNTPYYLAYRRRTPDESSLPAIADVQLFFARVPSVTPSALSTPPNVIRPTFPTTAAATARRLARLGDSDRGDSSTPSTSTTPGGQISSQPPSEKGSVHTLRSLLDTPEGYDDLIIPPSHETIIIPSQQPSSPSPTTANTSSVMIKMTPSNVVKRTFLFTKKTQEVEAFLEPGAASTPATTTTHAARYVSFPYHESMAEEEMMMATAAGCPFDVIPIVAVRRQRVGEEERWREDKAVVEVGVSYCDGEGGGVGFEVWEEEDEEEGGEGSLGLLNKTKWSTSPYLPPSTPHFTPLLLLRHNTPLGFCDIPFTTSVLSRTPSTDHPSLPLPATELPMFCYPTGHRLHRALFRDMSLPQCYGFVVKNERGDSIYVSCVSFMEPLRSGKKEQLERMGERRRRAFLPFRKKTDDTTTSFPYLTAFDEMTTFETKTICLVSRYPYWTAFRRFLSHLHLLASSTSPLPLERYVSHLLFTLSAPLPGGPGRILPLPALGRHSHAIFHSPPVKDLPLVDLPYTRLVSCLDAPMIVTLVAGYLALERKIILISTRPSLVLDICELLRGLLFPFELCAPYVPRLTQPFVSCLDFPGAIVVGVHDDQTEIGLSSAVRRDPPEDSVLVDLDAGRIWGDGDDDEEDDKKGYRRTWEMLPKEERDLLVREIEALCADAGITPGNEPLDDQKLLDDDIYHLPSPHNPPSLSSSQPSSPTHHDPFDDRALRDAFLRFFSTLLTGYDRHLVVPDKDFLISGDDWFDSQRFISSRKAGVAGYIGQLVGTQLFQSFIQRRTESGDVRCVLFDECVGRLSEEMGVYGRLSGGEEGYSLLVDRCCDWVEGVDSSRARSVVESDADTSVVGGGSGHRSGTTWSLATTRTGTTAATFPYSAHATTMTMASGDVITMAGWEGIRRGSVFVYMVDGCPCFPESLDKSLYWPPERNVWDKTKDRGKWDTVTAVPVLTRSERELEDANRRRKIATSYRGLHNQRRCMWQLPKLMASHFLGCYLLPIPSQISQPSLPPPLQHLYLLRALGTLRLLRSTKRLIPDEAAYRCLMVACAKTPSDRRLELVKLFGLLRSDGIFPSAVTLGQYTRGIATGFAKRGREGDGSSGEGMMSGEVWNKLDESLGKLEDGGRKWRGGKAASDKEVIPEETTKKKDQKKTPSSWRPVTLSSSFSPLATTKTPSESDFRVVALWSRASSCETCSYVPLDEEIQAGWDVVGGTHPIPDAISCPKCGALTVPHLGYHVMTLDEARAYRGGIVGGGNEDGSGSNDLTKKFDKEHATRKMTTTGYTSLSKHKRNHSTSSILPTDDADNNTTPDFNDLPPQIRPIITSSPPKSSSLDPDIGTVPYLSPSRLRLRLEQHVETTSRQQQNGAAADVVLERDELRKIDPVVFFNFWWYCARFSLPLPLPLVSERGEEDEGDETPQVKNVGGGLRHMVAIAAWDRTTATLGCKSAAQSLTSFIHRPSLPPTPLLSHFNLTNYSPSDWDHDDLSQILVALVQACDKRDFQPVLESLLSSNKRRKQKYKLYLQQRQAATASTSATAATLSESLSAETLNPPHSRPYLPPPVELDPYRTILYLARYQCTTAFHVFFPASVRVRCKGYHFWCVSGTPLPMFDRLFREAVKRVNNGGGGSGSGSGGGDGKGFVPIHDVGDVALGFRCVFGHVI